MLKNLSKIGLGTMKLKDERLIVQAIKTANVNYIDTSSNYENAHNLIKKAFESEPNLRSQVTINSKLGYKIQNEDASLLSDSTFLSDQFVSCISPAYIRYELEKTKQNMGSYPDGLSLHNPEFFFTKALRRGIQQKPEEEFYFKIQQSFETMELLVKEKKIKWYGISTNTKNCFYSVTGNLHQNHQPYDESTDVNSLLNCAKKAAMKVWGHENDHFAMIESPFNLIEYGAQQDFELCKKNNILTVGNRPLQAITPHGFGVGDWGRQHKMFRLVEQHPLIPERALVLRVLRDHIGQEAYKYNIQQMALWINQSIQNLDITLSGLTKPAHIDDIKIANQLEKMDQQIINKIHLEINNIIKEYENIKRG